MLRHRAFILTLLGIFFAIVLYNLYWVAERFRIERKLGAMAPEARNAWLKDADNYKYYRRAVENSFTLGLDLQGGMYVTLEVGVEDILRGLCEVPQDTLFRQTLEEAVRRYRRGEGNLVDLFARVLKEKSPNTTLAQFFAGPKLGLAYDASDGEVLAKLRQEVEDAVDRTYKILRVRIDQFGVVSPNIQRQPGTGRILLELPGVKDSERVRKLLRTTAQLEFWPTYTIKETFPLLQKANEKIAAIQAGRTDTTSAADTTKKAADTTQATPSSTEEILLGKKEKPRSDTATKSDTAASEEEKRKRFEKENPLFSVLIPPQNPPESSPVIGYARISDTATVNSYLRQPEVQMLFPDNLAFAWTVKPEQEGSDVLTLIALRVNPNRQAPLTGEAIEDARQDFNPDDGRPMVTMRMNAEGSRIWKRLTTDYLEKSIAVVLDGYVYTYPVVQSVIANGNSQITGNFTVEEAKDLANVLKAGRLPASIRIEAEEIVGPSLGEITIRQGLIALGIAFVSILLTMWLFYSTAGLIADIALLLLVLFMTGVMAAMNVVLTLPGIAGIVLTLGMAVDANILIYERILEELRTGKSLKGAIESGFNNALSAIVDSNLTTLIAGLILYAFGIGPIRGFAVTLIIGILGTLLTGVLITRLMVEGAYSSSRWNPHLRFRSESMERFMARIPNIDFARQYPRSRWIALALTVLGVIAIFGLGIRQGLEFTGGYQFQVALSRPADLDALRADLTEAFKGNTPVIKTVGAKNDVLISTSYLYDQPNMQSQVESALLTGLRKRHADANPQITRSALIGPTIAEDIRSSAFTSVIFGILGIALYILLRFRSLAYSIGSALSLVATTAILLGVYAALSQSNFLPFSLEANQDTIAAVLTVIGYVINDAVILFDRIREERNRPGTESVSSPVLHSRSINLVLSRTILTTFTAALVVFILLLIGGENTKGFSLLLLLGFIIGIFSTIYVASDVSALLFERMARRKKAQPAPSR
ncbi:MAG: protein translocase subunit SecD [Bacteroidia bacterium]|nr:protein translocase subunit SecD [Bacteroidia bacterium]MCX7652068.1 protein translocase subunit SecD [Bacteroidia bacterium]MDW8416946.1 protein translocase subunit SecD [Bacteroidia bacterium]